MKHDLVALFSFLAFFLPVAAAANPFKTVGTAAVHKGLSQLEYRIGISEDNDSAANDGRFQSRLFYDYGFTDTYALRVTMVHDDLGVGAVKYDGLFVDNRFQLIERDRHGFDGGLRLSYYFRDGSRGPDNLDVRWITMVPFGAGYEFRNQVIVTHQTGDDAVPGIRPELRWQLTMPTVGRHRAGVEMFNEFGNLRDDRAYSEQWHDAGLVFTGPIYGATRYQVGWRRSLSRNAPDNAFKFIVGYDF